jgi:hypothetical protein
MYDVFDFPLWTMPAPVVSPRLAQAFPLPQDATYIDFMGAGYTDVWSKGRSEERGIYLLSG